MWDSVKCKNEFGWNTAYNELTEKQLVRTHMFKLWAAEQMRIPQLQGYIEMLNRLSVRRVDYQQIEEKDRRWSADPFMTRHQLEYEFVPFCVAEWEKKLDRFNVKGANLEYISAYSHALEHFGIEHTDAGAAGNYKWHWVAPILVILGEDRDSMERVSQGRATGRWSVCSFSVVRTPEDTVEPQGVHIEYADSENGQDMLHAAVCDAYNWIRHEEDSHLEED